ncbi:MAG: PorT family protein [Bacteroidia bacterium]|nr:PorT family protein [Bacteroidia bacterium]
MSPFQKVPILFFSDFLPLVPEGKSLKNSHPLGPGQKLVVDNRFLGVGPILKRIAAILFCFFTLACFSQQEFRPKNLPKYDNKVLHFGFTLGLNTMDFRIHPATSFMSDSIDIIENNRRLGFNISIVSSLRLGQYLDLRFLPGLSFGQRDMDYSQWDTSRKVMATKRMKIESTFIDFPLVFKYKAKRIVNYSPYVIGGMNFALDLASQKEVKEEEKPKIRLKPFDVYYEFGFGIDYYLTYFKFSTEIKFAVGLFDILRRDDTKYTSAIQRMNSNIIFICFHFE